MEKNPKKQNSSINNRLIIGEKIRKYRLLNEYTIEQLSEKLDITANHLSKIECASSTPSLSLLIKISNTLNVSTDTILASNLINNSLTGDSFTEQLLNKCNHLNLKDREFILNFLDLYISKNN